MTDLTNAELRRRIAELEGWDTRRTETGLGMKWELLCPDDGPIYVQMKPPHQRSVSSWFDTEDEAWQHLPDWPSDPGAALALCRRIAYERDYKFQLYWFTAAKVASLRQADPNHTVIVAYFLDVEGYAVRVGEANEDALAMSRLAYNALKAREVTP